jgi:alanyl-tRNA synthetase
MTLKEIRYKYLKFFSAKGGSASGGEKKGHTIVPSSSLVPESDPTTLFTGSGMQPMITYLLGSPHPEGSRITDSQKCFRAEDIDEVGDNRHTCYFEMLGNWSLGDYWKKEQLSWFFEFLTKELKLDPKRLYATVFAGDSKFNIARDTASAEIWKSLFAEKEIDTKEVELLTEEDGYEKGMQNGRIFYYGAAKNWWSRAGVPEQMPQGEPGGPDSEVFYEFENIEHDTKFGKHCHPNCDCGRFVEIGNSVFMEYFKTEQGTFEKLKQRNVDFGGGLERIAAAVEGSGDIFRIDAMWLIVEHLEELFGNKYGDHPDVWYTKGEDRDEMAFRRACRIVADHIRAAVFMIADGVLPSNKERGYILRRLIRKAVFEGYKQGEYPPTWLSDVARIIIEYYDGHYKDLHAKEQSICEELTKETKKFYATLETGLKIITKYLGEKDRKLITGEEAFILFTTYGFPLELTREKASEAGFSVDEEGFKREFEKHQDLSRTSTAGVFKGGLADSSEQTTRLHTAHHLLLKALQIVLGGSVKQRGSNITQERLRLDFSYGQKMTDDEKRQVEEIVNDKIKEDLPVIHSELPKEEAEKLGAEHEFGQKYPDRVSIYSIGPKDATPENPDFKNAFSIEFCGGPHVSRTGLIGEFKIQKEEAVAAGIRRIKAGVEYRI